MITLSGMSVTPPGGDSRPPKRRKDTSNIYAPGLFGGKRQRYQVNQSHPYPQYGAPVHLCGTGKMLDRTAFPVKLIKLEGYSNSRPE